ncbi:uncharacterized protein [Nicotiana tomentosiformis]|uniref:uncharacterized protein n=1 Tax=Nicotiana tomentosiformis TaxID=4098 RepID=UPI00051BD7CB|nr:uncharacterized protein LOC104109435 [Nicotiana tomentosiformis]
MDIFLKKLDHSQPSSSSSCPSLSPTIAPEIRMNANLSHLIDELNLESLKDDPGERMPLVNYSPRIREEVRKHYIHKGPCQPSKHQFPKTKIGNKMRQFNSSWFEGPFSGWLEYSVKKDAAYCLCCYLFKHEFIHGSAGEVFSKIGFRAWNKALERLRLHAGEANSVHHKCFNKMLGLSNHHQSIQAAFDKQSEKLKSEQRMRSEASVDVAKLLLHYGLPLFHTLQHLMDSACDDSDKSINAPARDCACDAKAMAATPADMKEYPNSYVLIVDTPGLKSGDIKVQVEDDNVLLISGERKREEEKEGGKYIKMERGVGKFMRKFTLPENINTDAISAVCQDGILTVTVEKLLTPRLKKRKTIEVKFA